MGSLEDITEFDALEELFCIDRMSCSGAQAVNIVSVPSNATVFFIGAILIVHALPRPPLRRSH